MDPTGITWLDWVMAGMTIFGFALTGYGLAQTWKQARHAKTAADSARSAVTATRSRLMAVDLVNEFAAVRTSANHVVLATESNNPEVAKFALVQLADAMRRAVTLAREPGSPEVDDAIIAQLDSSSRDASMAKAELAKRQAPKVRTYTQDLLPALADLNHSLLEFETAQKYIISEGD